MTRLRREKLKTWAWLAGLVLLFAELALLPPLLLDLLLNLAYPDRSPWWLIPQVLLNAAWIFILLRNIFILLRNISIRNLNTLFWSRWTAEELAQARPDDIADLRETFCAMEIEDVVRRWGFEGRPWTAYWRRDMRCKGLFWANHEVRAQDLRKVEP